MTDLLEKQREEEGQGGQAKGVSWWRYEIFNKWIDGRKGMNHS